MNNCKKLLAKNIKKAQFKKKYVKKNAKKRVANR